MSLLHDVVERGLRRALEILGFGTTTSKGKKVRPSLRQRAFRHSRARRLLFEQVEDRRVLASVSAAAMQGTVTEGSPAVIYFNVSPPSSSPITVNYQSAGGSATQNVDFQGVTGSVTIGPNQSFATVSVNTLTDSLTESPETFSVTITSASGATVGTASTTVTINDGSGGGGGGGGGTVSIVLSDIHYYVATVEFDLTFDLDPGTGKIKQKEGDPYAAGNVSRDAYASVLMSYTTPVINNTGATTHTVDVDVFGGIGRAGGYNVEVSAWGFYTFVMERSWSKDYGPWSPHTQLVAQKGASN